MTDFGTDVSTFPDLDPTFAPISGFAVVAEACARRLATVRGGLFYDKHYGFDLRTILNDTPTPAQLAVIAGQVSAECQKDERVLKADAKLSLDRTSSTLTVQVRITTASGPFTLVLAVSAVTVSLVTFG